MGNKQNRAKRNLRKSNNWRRNIKMRKRKAKISKKLTDGIQDVRKVYILKTDTENTENELYHSALWNAEIGCINESIVIDVNENPDEQNFKFDDFIEYDDGVDSDEKVETMNDDTGTQIFDFDELIEYEGVENFDWNGDRQEAKMNAETGDLNFEIDSSIDELIEYDDKADEDNVEYIDYVDEDNVEYVDYDNEEKNEAIKRFDCGMTNFKNNCFFNVILQVLFHLPAFVDCMQGDLEHTDCVTCSLRETLRETQYSSQIAICPMVSYKVMQKKYMNLFNGQQQDAHEVLIKLMESMEDPKHPTSGHYTTILATNDGIFYKFNDSLVHQIPFSNVMRSGDVYILVYEISNPSVPQMLANIESKIIPQYHRNKKIQILSNILIVAGTENNENIENETSNNCNIRTEKDYNFKSGSENVDTHENSMIEANDNSGDQNFEFDDFIEYDDGVDDQNSIDDRVEEDRIEAITADADIQRNYDIEDSACNYDIDLELPKNEINLSGRRIVDINFVLKQLQELNKHPKSRRCNFSDMVPVKEIKRGLRSIILFRCPICKYYEKVESCPQIDDSIGINGSVTLGMTSVGLGFYHLEEFCANVDMPCMSESTFCKENKKLQDNWMYLAKKSEMEALREEIRLAILAGEVDSKGNALITVIVDGSWGKRSYGKGFTSLSGCATIIGLRTKRIIYFGVKNKYCHTCVLSYAKTCPPNDHQCNINYYGPSSGMESEILLEGFKSCEKLGARFAAFISDGDSTFYKEIRESRLYIDPDLIVEKYECTNHLFRNFRKAFKKLSGIKEFKVACRKYITEAKGDDICKGIRIAATHWRESNVDMIEKLNNLERDCLNAPLHYYGIHDKCDPYFCHKKTTPESYEIINLLKAEGLFQEILNLCQDYFVSNVKSLLVDHTNNWAEEFNSIVAKYLGGKRINYSLARSYSARIAASVVQYNSGGHGNSIYQEFFNMNSERCLQLEHKRQKKLANGNEEYCKMILKLSDMESDAILI